ncbi:MAG TPA: hypothetical protein VM733_08515 [Thermoanaerobaculia bacterium]|nr:hypothetical protein [Thermoanaerobaculia bacterium]
MLAALALLSVLFPAPLHLTREVTDPIRGSKSVIEEYCHGNRVVSVSGHRTAIAEYDKGTVTTIDFDAGTYSVATFDELAKAWPAPKSSPAMRVTPDPHHTVSREAAEVLLGAAYPLPPLSDKVLGTLRSGSRMASNSAGAPVEYALPAEQIVELGEGLELRNSVVRVGSELAPADVMSIPPGARRVEAKELALRRMAAELDGQR